jgi:uncharacterized membrane protein YhhN
VARPVTAVYAVVAVADTALAATGRQRARRATKPLLMPVLMVGRDRDTRRALALGGIGDMCLLGTGDAAFTAGLGSFLAGHVAWVVAMRRRHRGGVLRARPVLSTPYLLAFAGLNAYLWPRTGKDRVPVLLYSAALLTTALVGLDSGSRRAAAGGALFLVSDTLLALERFGGIELPAHEGLVVATYTVAQGLLAAPA